MAEQEKEVIGTYPYQVGTTVSYTGYGRGSLSNVEKGIVWSVKPDNAKLTVRDHSGRQLELHMSEIVGSPYKSWVAPGNSIRYDSDGKGKIKEGVVDSIARAGYIYLLGSKFAVYPHQVIGPAQKEAKPATTIDSILAKLTPEQRQYILDNYDIVKT